MAYQTQLAKSTYRLASVSAPKSSSVKLGYVPRALEFNDPFFLLHYEADDGGEPVPYVDIFSKHGEPIHRINIKRILHE